MGIDWSYVKQKTLWQYNDLIKKILDVFGYSFVQEFYNHTMDEAAEYTIRILQGYMQNRKEGDFLEEISSNFLQLAHLQILDYIDLVQRIETEKKCEIFVREKEFDFQDLINILNYIFRWVLPFKCPLKELVDTIDYADQSALQTLRNNDIKSSLDVLENLRIRENRQVLANQTGLSSAFLLNLTNRADISRLAYVRGKTIRHLCGGGYCSMSKLASADIKQMEADMSEYYQSIGKTFSDFKAVIPLDWMIGGARILPKVVQE